ncbi:MAG: response regulator [Bacteroidales bacterium]|nr:response regulator [Bacteroidales bacterium]
MTKYRVIIIDDEEPARDIIKHYLLEHPDFEIVAECENGFAGLKAIHEHNPDLLFLDVQMPKISGFELLEVLQDMPVVIFSTAYDEYAIKAFDMNAVDYLLKPFGQERFDRAVEKASKRLRDSSNHSEPIKKLIESIPVNQDAIDRVVVRSGTKIRVIPVGQIEYLEAYDDYVQIYTVDGRFLKQKTMKYFETHLDHRQFIRVHRSFIVRLAEIVQMEPYEKDSKVLILKSGRRIKVSKTRLKALRVVLGI